jgi:hypothetical protein
LNPEKVDGSARSKPFFPALYLGVGLDEGGIRAGGGPRGGLPGGGGREDGSDVPIPCMGGIASGQWPCG